MLPPIPGVYLMRPHPDGGERYGCALIWPFAAHAGRGAPPDPEPPKPQPRSLAAPRAARPERGERT